MPGPEFLVFNKAVYKDFEGSVYLSNVGIGTTFARTSLHIGTTDGVILPGGTELQRPTPVPGLIRYNTTTTQFEGYTSTGWEFIGGGVIPDSLTYISASNDSNLRFYTAGNLRMTINPSGNVGIGTAIELERLHVEGNIALSGADRFIGTRTGHELSIRTNNVDRVNINTVGNVGIGTAIELERLHVEGNVALSGANRFIGTRTGHELSLRTNNVDRVNINTLGNVGIGTTLPTDALQVQGNILASGSIDTGIQFLGQANDTVTAPSFSWSTDTNCGIYRPAADTIAFTTAGTEKVRIVSGGSVGIGTTATGTHSLQVQGSVNATAGLNVGATSVIDSSGNIPSADRLPVVTVAKGGTGQTSLTAGKLLVGTGTSAVTLSTNLHWDSGTNRLGVGTATPLQTFNVFGNALIDGTLSASNMVVLGDFTTLNTLTSNTEQMVINNAGTGPALIVRQTGPQPVAEFIDAESGSALLIANDGKIGIGTTIPTEALRVQGNILASGSINTGTQFLGQANDTVTAPSFSWSTDTNCGIYRPAADTIAFTTAGTEKVRIASNGNVGIGTTVARSTFEINGSLQVGNAVMSPYTTNLPLFACRAFVAFNNTFNVLALTITAAGNVASVTKSSSTSPIFRITFQVAMPNNEYCVLATHSAEGTGDLSGMPLITRNTAYVEITPQRNTSPTDPRREDNPAPTNIHVAIFM